jgi:hypothetical protein
VDSARSVRDVHVSSATVNSDFRFVVSDEKYNYVSGRFPPDAQLLADKAIELVKTNLKH